MIGMLLRTVALTSLFALSSLPAGAENSRPERWFGITFMQGNRYAEGPFDTLKECNESLKKSADSAQARATDLKNSRPNVMSAPREERARAQFISERLTQQANEMQILANAWINGGICELK